MSTGCDGPMPGVPPIESWEATEIGVGGMQLGLIFDGDGSKMGVGRQVAGRA